jgi:hypothetical protein
MRIDPYRIDVATFAAAESDHALIECIDEYVHSVSCGWPGIYSGELCEQLNLDYEPVRRVTGRLAALARRGLVDVQRSLAEHNSYALTDAGIEAARMPIKIEHDPKVAAALDARLADPTLLDASRWTIRSGDSHVGAEVTLRSADGRHRAELMLATGGSQQTQAWGRGEADSADGAVRDALAALGRTYALRLRA